MKATDAVRANSDEGLTLDEQCEKMIQDAKNGIVTTEMKQLVDGYQDAKNGIVAPEMKLLVDRYQNAIDGIAPTEMKRIIDGHKKLARMSLPSFLQPKNYNIEGTHSVSGAQWDYIYGVLAKNFGYTPDQIGKLTIRDIEPLFRFLENSSNVGESNASTPGPKPGQAPAGRKMCEQAISLLEGGRFPRGRGRLTEIAHKLSQSFPHKPNSIEKQIRLTVKEWEKKNPDR